jgi:hypothetical protein
VPHVKIQVRTEDMPLGEGWDETLGFETEEQARIFLAKLDDFCRELWLDLTEDQPCLP